MRLFWKDSELSRLITTDHIISCEKCGCLLLKEKRFKRESTIETSHALKYVFNPWFAGFNIGTSEERIKEHYICNRCFKGGKK